MITKIEGLPDTVAGFRASGEVTANDYEEVLMPDVEDKLSRHGKISLLYVLGPDFTGFTAGALWDDTKTGLKHRKEWERIAVVTDADWIRHAVRWLGFVIPAEIHVFDHANLEDASDWVCAHKTVA